MKPLLKNTDYENAARLLGCEVAAIKAVAAFTILNTPISQTKNQGGTAP